MSVALLLAPARDRGDRGRRAAIHPRAGGAREQDRLAGVDPAERRRLQLLEERDRALAALSELELDHRTGKVSDEDYAVQIGPLRARAAAALRALDSPSAGAGPAGARRARRARFAGSSCRPSA